MYKKADILSHKISAACRNLNRINYVIVNILVPFVQESLVIQDRKLAFDMLHNILTTVLAKKPLSQ